VLELIDPEPVIPELFIPERLEFGLPPYDEDEPELLD